MQELESSRGHLPGAVIVCVEVTGGKVSYTVSTGPQKPETLTVVVEVTGASVDYRSSWISYAWILTPGVTTCRLGLDPCREDGAGDHFCSNCYESA